MADDPLLPINSQKILLKQATSFVLDSSKKEVKPESIWDYFDTFSKFLAGIAFVCWMIQEWIIPRNRIFLLIAIALGLADVFYLILHKIFQRKRLFIGFGWILYFVLISFIAKNKAETITKHQASFDVFIDGVNIKKHNEIWSVNQPSIEIAIKNINSNTVENLYVNFVADTGASNLNAVAWQLQPGAYKETNGVIEMIKGINMWRVGPFQSLGGLSTVSMPSMILGTDVNGKKWHVQVGVRGLGTLQEKYEAIIFFTNHFPEKAGGTIVRSEAH